MARVNIVLHKDISLVTLDAIARACRGEFFGSMTTGGLQFGFACAKHARLFTKKLEQINVNANPL